MTKKKRKRRNVEVERIGKKKRMERNSDRSISLKNKENKNINWMQKGKRIEFIRSER